MPTAGRLAGAIALAFLGWVVAGLVIPAFQEGKVPSFWFPLCVGSGIWAGWVVLGKRVGGGYPSAFGHGLTGMIAMAFWVLFITSGVEMIEKSMRRSYDGPIEAVVNVFEIMLGYCRDLYTSEVIMVLAVGGIIAGLFTEFFAKRYP